MKWNNTIPKASGNYWIGVIDNGVPQPLGVYFLVINNGVIQPYQDVWEILERKDLLFSDPIPFPGNPNLIEEFFEAISKAWCKETSYYSEWDESNPSKGQCAVSALLAQKVLGGSIIKGIAILPNSTTESHYFNRLSNGDHLDCTIDQFPKGTRIEEHYITTSTELKRSKGTLQERYDLLVKRFKI